MYELAESDMSVTMTETTMGFPAHELERCIMDILS